MSEQSVDILVIGNGVSAKALLWEIEFSCSGQKVLQVSSDHLFPKTSLSSTAIVAKHGMKRGISPLGDILCDGVDHFFKNVYGTGLMGLEKASFYELALKEDKDNIGQRYGNSTCLSKGDLPFGESAAGVHFFKEDCLFINASVFLSALDEQFSSPLKVMTLIGIQQKQAVFLGGEKINFKKLVLCSGVGLCHLAGLGLKSDKKINEVSGAFLKWKINLPCKSFAYGLGAANLVYRDADQSLMLGGSTQKQEVFAPDLAALREFYEKALELGLNWIPSFDEADIVIGSRVKGPKRLPLFEEVAKDIFVLGASYKNGWSQAFWGAKAIVRELF